MYAATHRVQSCWCKSRYAMVTHNFINFTLFHTHLSIIVMNERDNFHKMNVLHSLKIHIMYQNRIMELLNMIFWTSVWFYCCMQYNKKICNDFCSTSLCNQQYILMTNIFLASWMNLLTLAQNNAIIIFNNLNF